MTLLRVVPLVLLRVVLQFHRILGGNPDFFACRPIGFAACSPSIIFTVRTTRSKINHDPP